MKRRHERPLRRVNPSGRTVWVARWTDRNGKRHAGMPPDIPGTFDMKREAQAAIDACYDLHYNAPAGPVYRNTVGDYATTWTRRHPRTDRTNRSYRYRVEAVLNVELDGVPFKLWQMEDVRPRQIDDLIDHMLRVQGRAAAGANGILRTLSAMWRNARRDDAAHYNPFQDAMVRASDPRIVKAPRRRHVYTFEQMRGLAACAPGVYGEAMIRVLSDCGLRLGEMLPLERGDLRFAGVCDHECPARDVPHLHVERTAYDGQVQDGTKTTRGRAVAGRVAPVPDSTLVILRGLPPRLDTRLLFPSPRGRVLQTRAFYREVWYPARVAAGLPVATPHEFRHSWVSVMRAAAIDVADVASAAGHTVETATKVYTHPLGRSFDLMREVGR